MKNTPFFLGKFFQQLIMNCKWNLIFILGFIGFNWLKGFTGFTWFSWIIRVITSELKKNTFQHIQLTNALKINKNGIYEAVLLTKNN